MISRPVAFISLLIAIVSVPSKRSFAAPDAKSLELLNRVTNTYAVNREAILRIEYRYVYDLNGSRRLASFARDGEKKYHAAVWRQKSSHAMPWETSWDGKTAYVRRVPGRLDIGSNPKDYQLTAPLPDGKTGAGVDVALGLQTSDRQRYEFLGAKRVIENDQELVELEFAAPWIGGKLNSTHSQAVGYWPVKSVLTRRDGGREEMTESRYQTILLGGDKLYFPVEVHVLVYGDDDVARSVVRVNVDPVTLKVNQPIAPERFALTPWPNESVYDLDARRILPAAVPEWSPVGRVGFPWDQFVVERLEARRKAIMGP